MRKLITLGLVLGQLAWSQDYRERRAAGEQALVRGEYPAAVEAFQSAALAVGAAVGDPTAISQVGVRLVEVHLIAGDLDEAERIARKMGTLELPPDLAARNMLALASIKRLRGDFAGALGEISAAHQHADRGQAVVLATILAEESGILLETGKYKEAATVASQLDQLLRGLQTAPLLTRLHPARTAYFLGKYDEADALLSALEPDLPRGSGHPERLAWAQLKAAVMAAKENVGAALDTLASVCELWLKAASPGRWEPGACQADRGLIAYLADRAPQAAESGRKAADALVRYPPNQPLGTRHDLAAAQTLIGLAKAGEARTLLVRAAANRASLFGGTAVPTLEVRLLMGNQALAEARIAEAQAEYSRILTATEGSLDPRHWLRRKAQAGLIRCLAAQGEWQRLEPIISEWKKNRRQGADDSLELAFVVRIEGAAAVERKKFAVAEPLLVQSLTLMESLAGSDPAEAWKVVQLLADVRAALGEHQQAAQLLRNRIGRYGEVFNGLSAAEQIDRYTRLADWHEAAGEKTLAVAALDKVVTLNRNGEAAILQVLERLGRLSSEAAKPQEALRYYRRSWQIRQITSQTDADGAILCLATLADLEQRHGDASESVALWLRLAELGNVGRGPAAQNRGAVLERLAASQASAGKQQDAVKTYIQLARLGLGKGDAELAQTYAERARSTAPSSSAESASALFILANVQFQKGGDQDADKFLRQILEGSESNATARALCLAQLARIAIRQKQMESARELAQRAMTLLDEVRVPSIQANIRAVLASLQAAQGNVNEADVLYSSFLEAEASMDIDQDLPMLSLLAEAAQFYSVRKRPELVETIGRRRLAVSQKAFGESSAESAWAMQSLADTLTSIRKSDEALRLYDKALTIFGSLKGVKSPEAMTLLLSIADFHRIQGDLNEALRHYQEAIQLMPTQEPSKLSPILSGIADLQQKKGNPQAAVETYAKLVALWNTATPNPQWISATRNWCLAMIDAGKFDDGLRECAKLRKAVRAANGSKDSLAELSILKPLASILKRSNRKEAAAIDREFQQMSGRLGVGQ
jgi:hypothetical protein